MNRTFLSVALTMGSVSLCAALPRVARAQENPPPLQQPAPPPPEARDGNGPGGAGPQAPPIEERMRMRRMQEGGPGGPGGPGGGPGGPGGGPGGPGDGRGPMGRGPFGPGGGGSAAFAQLEMMRGYLDLVDRYSRMSRDPVSSGVAAVVMAGDVLKPRGPQAAIDYFNKALPDVKNPTVQRAIHLQLADLYKQSQQVDKALDELKAVMLMPSESDQATPPPMPPPGGGPGRR